MATTLSSRRDRVRAAAAAIVVQGVLGYALITGLAMHFVTSPSDALEVFDAAPDRPRRQSRRAPDPAKDTRREGAASPANLQSTATEVVAPPPVLPVIVPPIVAAPVPNVGVDASQGASDLPGPGTGSGGFGNGTGSGGSGDGEGGGDAETPPELVRGRLKFSDIPFSMSDAGVGGTVGVRYVVATSGRVTECFVTRPSGNNYLDALTCRLIRERFRFRPSRDEAGRPVASVIVENHSWINELGDER